MLFKISNVKTPFFRFDHAFLHLGAPNDIPLTANTELDILGSLRGQECVVHLDDVLKSIMILADD